MPYVTERWLGGMLTNFNTVHQRLQRLKELEDIQQGIGGLTDMTKKESLQFDRERIKLTRALGGVRKMAKVPDILWVVDTNKEALAVAEARKLGIPVVAILDTNCDPDVVDFPVPGNDDAIRSIALLTRVVADAVAEGLQLRASRNQAAEAANQEAEAAKADVPAAALEAEELARAITEETSVAKEEAPANA
jgi:small subunit ribosomal protein S2